MIAIVNVDKNVRESGPHEYEVRINREPLFRFTHDREKPIFKLFIKAAFAARRMHRKNKESPCEVSTSSWAV